MDITDFSAGIVIDVDPQDGAGVPTGATELVNFDIEPGALVQRAGTQRKQYDYSSYNWSTKALTAIGTAAAGTGLPLADEEIIQIVRVYAPDAKTGSVKGLGTTYEHCLNQDVTVILVRITSTDTYRLYADFTTKGKFLRVVTSGATAASWKITGIAGSVPFMIARQSAVAIGNVYVFDSAGAVTTDPGVLWLGHIKKLVGWTRAGTTFADYKYLNQIDEWRLCNAECYPSTDDLLLELRASNYSLTWNQGSPIFGALDTVYAGSGGGKAVTEAFASRMLIGQLVRNVNIKGTLLYDGYQESRPAQWTKDKYSLFTSKSWHSPTPMDVSTAVLPVNWNIRTDKLHNQFVRLEMSEKADYCYLKYEPDTSFTTPYGSHDLMRGGVGVAATGPPPDNLPYLVTNFGAYITLKWNNRYYERDTVSRSGDTFYIKFISPSVVSSNDVYTWQQNKNGEYDGLEIRIDRMPKLAMLRNIGGVTGYYFNFRILAILLGSPFTDLEKSWGSAQDLLAAGLDPSDAWVMAHFRWAKAVAASTWDTSQDRSRIWQYWTVIDERYVLDPASSAVAAKCPYYRLEPLDSYPIYSNATTPANYYESFSPSDFSSLGMLYVDWKFKRAHFVLGSGDTSAVLLTGTRRITGCCTYVKEDDTDLDYRRIRRTNLDYNEADKDHGGTGEDEDLVNGFNYRETAGVGTTPGYNPTWMDDGTYFRPYFASPFAAGYSSQGIFMRSGISDAFTITEQDIVDTGGASLLSANMLRDETKTDAPVWKRGALCEGRLFAISNKTGDIQYSVVSGGVAQYDIMPGSFHVAKGETLTHIVSWRGQHHMIFTNLNLWRMDLADGDELSWRIMDTYLQQGTEFWKTIVDTPKGLYYGNRNGIFVYAGQSVESVTRERWEKTYQTQVLSVGTEDSYGGYDAVRGDVHFSMAGSITVYDWVYNIGGGHWRKYLFSPGIRPAYMLSMDGEWHLSFGAADWRTRDRTNKYDTAVPGTPNYYSVLYVSQELPPISEIDIPYWQYLGVRYSANTTPHAKVCLISSSLDDHLYDTLFVDLPPARHEHFTPLRAGFNRGMRVVFGIGSYFSDNPGAADVRLSSLSFRGTQHQQWSGSR